MATALRVHVAVVENLLDAVFRGATVEMLVVDAMIRGLEHHCTFPTLQIPS